MSQANMEQMGNEAKSFDSLLHYDDLPQEKNHDEDALIEGEVLSVSGVS